MTVESGKQPTPILYDVALSFAGEDRPYVAAVADALARRGVRCFYDADEEIELWGRYLPEELPAIYSERSSVVVIFISARYAEKAWGRLERRAALDRAMYHPGVFLLPARFDDTVIPGLLSGVATLDLRGRSPEDVAAVIQSKLTALGHTNQNTQSMARPSSVAPSIWNVPSRLRNFTGRDGLLDRLDRALRTGSVAISALHGLGGVGKTQLAIEYLHRHSTEYSLVWWINAEQVGLVEQQLAALGVRLGLPAKQTVRDDARAVLDALRNRLGWLLVYDNAEHPGGIQLWLPSSAHGRVLITSRTPNWATIADRIEVDVLSEDDAVSFLLKRLPTFHRSLEKMATKLAHELGYLPLALEQASAYIDSVQISPAAYLSRFQTRRREFLSRGEDVVYRGRLDTVWAFALDSLALQVPKAATLASLIALLGPEPIPLRVFTATSIEGIPLTGPDPDSEIDELVAVLLRFSLVRREQNYITMHRLVQAVIRERLAPDQREYFSETVLALMESMTSGDPHDPNNWPQWASVIPHLLSAPALHSDGNLKLEYRNDARHLLFSASRYLYSRGNYALSNALASRLRHECTDLLGADHPDTLTAAQYEASALQGLGELQGARILSEETLAHRRRVLGPDHPDTLASAHNLGHVMYAQGDYRGMRPLAEDTLERRHRVLGPDHADTLLSANNLARGLAKVGHHEAARELDTSTLARYRRVLGVDHPASLRTANNLARDLSEVGDHMAAVNLVEDTLSRYERVLGKEHPDTLFSAHSAAELLSKARHHEKAAKLARRTVYRSRRVLGWDHPDTIVAANVLAQVLAGTGSHHAAHEVAEDTVRRSTRVLGAAHPHTVQAELLLAEAVRLCGCGESVG